MQTKTTRAFRTISEAGEELGLQPHVLRFWESKFPDIKPIKRGGGRRFYRPEDIELLRGIKILLHEEKHPIKDVQKLIRLKGAGSIVDLGRSVEKAATPKAVKDTVLIPERIQNTPNAYEEQIPESVPIEVTPDPVIKPPSKSEFRAQVIPAKSYNLPQETQHKPISKVDQSEFEQALHRLEALKRRWQAFLD